MIKAFRPWRRLVGVMEAVAMLGLPFLQIGGQSALRFDVPTLKLYFFGTSIWIEEFFLVLIALLFVTFLIIFITLVFGRIWCGWVCPQTVLSDFTSFADGKGEKRGPAGRAGGLLLLMLISIVVGADLIWFFVSPYEFFPRLTAGELGPVIWGIWISLSVIMFLNLWLLRRRFCATVCPYAKMQSVLYDRNTLVIAFDPNRKDQCRECRACVNVCPVDIDIREGLSPACINCAECIDACTQRMEKRGLKSLISYSFGLPGEAARVVRQNAVAIGMVTLLSLVFLVYLSVTAQPFDVTVVRNVDFVAGAGEEPDATGSFVLSFRNLEDSPLDIVIAVPGAKVAPGMVEGIAPGEARRVTVYVTLDEPAREGERIREIQFVMTPEDGERTVRQRAKIILPGSF